VRFAIRLGPSQAAELFLSIMGMGSMLGQRREVRMSGEIVKPHEKPDEYLDRLNRRSGCPDSSGDRTPRATSSKVRSNLNLSLLVKGLLASVLRSGFGGSMNWFLIVKDPMRASSACPVVAGAK
jgi:hypothetical protein